MKTIHKFPLHIADTQFITAPKGSGFLHVGVQNDQPVLWARVDDEQPLETFTIAIVGTGQPVPELGDGYYLGTVQLPPFVWHVFVADVK